MPEYDKYIIDGGPVWQPEQLNTPAQKNRIGIP